MHQRNVMMRAAMSGAIWAGIAILMMAAVDRFESVGRIAWGLRGGIVAAPLIGIAVALCWPLFRDAGFVGRVAISLVTLYGAAFLFMLAAGLTPFATGGGRASLSRVFFDSWNAAIAGLTWTGFVLILGPMAFLNHLWISHVGSAACARRGAAG
jgi:hypothetical protein